MLLHPVEPTTLFASRVNTIVLPALFSTIRSSTAQFLNTSLVISLKSHLAALETCGLSSSWFCKSRKAVVEDLQKLPNNLIKPLPI